jgi:crotonobetainyl-CoA:carnitine CoA-transferase CaiB-like acyl-CoA transferase
LGALFAREKTGAGAKVETSLLQATLSFIGETGAGFLRTGQIPDRLARVKNAHAFAFVAKDGLPLVVHCSVPEKFWQAFLKAIEREDLGADPRFTTRDNRRKNYAALEEELAKSFSARTRSEWLKKLEENDVPAAPLYNMAEVLGDPQVKHLGLTEEVEHPTAGKLKFIGGAVSYEGIQQKESGPPPLLGEHTAKILAELGYNVEQVAALEKQGAVKIAER